MKNAKPHDDKMCYDFTQLDLHDAYLYRDKEIKRLDKNT